MKKELKKLVVTFAMVTVLGIVFTGCGDTAEPAEEAPAKTTTAAVTQTTEAAVTTEAPVDDGVFSSTVDAAPNWWSRNEDHDRIDDEVKAHSIGETAFLCV